MDKRMYYLIAGLAFVAVVCLTLTACNKKEKNEQVSELTVDKTELSFFSKGESREFNVIYTDEWRLEAEGLERYLGPNMAGIRNFTIMPAAGIGNAKITVTLNDEIAESYEIDLKIIGENSQDIVITLKANVTHIAQ